MASPIYPATILVLNICIAIASSKMPKIFLSASVAGFGNFLARKGVLLSTKKMISRLTTIPMMISTVWKLDLNESMVVKVPAPARSGKAIGTILPEELSEVSDLKK